MFMADLKGFMAVIFGFSVSLWCGVEGWEDSLRLRAVSKLTRASTPADTPETKRHPTSQDINSQCQCRLWIFKQLDNSKLGSTQHMITLTCCQDHILTENIWFVWYGTSYSGDERRCYRCGTTNERTTEDRATQPMEAGGWVSQLNYLRK